MIMVGAGTGLAPFRGFLQERAALRDQGVPVAPVAAVLRLPQPRTSTCSTPTSWRRTRRSGLVRVENAFSRATDSARRYVQDAMLDCADEVWDLLQQDAVVFVCGNASTIAPGVRGALTRIFRDQTGAGEADAAGLAGRAAHGRPVRRGHLGRLTGRRAAGRLPSDCGARSQPRPG